MNIQKYLLVLCLWCSPQVYACDSSLDFSLQEATVKFKVYEAKRIQGSLTEPVCTKESELDFPATIYLPKEGRPNFRVYLKTAKVICTYLHSHPLAGLLLISNTDERGTIEMNLALGSRYANSVRKFLVTLGCDYSRLSTISYGEEIPVDSGHTPKAWAKNRRVVVIPFLMKN